MYLKKGEKIMKQKNRTKANAKDRNYKPGIDLNQTLLKGRFIHLFDAITPTTALEVIKQIQAYDIKKKAPIPFYICSGGGDVTSTFAIINAMKFARSKIVTIATGRACSGAALVLISGNRRMSMPNTDIMFHDMYSCFEDYHGKTKYRIKRNDRLWDTTVDMIKKHTKFTDKDFETLKNGELWLSPEEAKSKGVIDKIL